MFIFSLKDTSNLCYVHDSMDMMHVLNMQPIKHVTYQTCNRMKENF